MSSGINAQAEEFRLETSGQVVDTCNQHSSTKKRRSKKSLKRLKRKEEYIKRLLAMSPDKRRAFLDSTGGKVPKGMEIGASSSSQVEANMQQKKRNRKHKNQRNFHVKRQKRQAAEFKDIKYEIRNGLRHVVPYKHIYETFAKGRWTNRSLYNVFTSEFGSNPESYYRAAISLGLITVNGECKSLDYNVCNGDLIRHITHKHEPPVKGDPIEVVTTTKDIVIVNKPPCLPVHACGAYIHNCVQHVLARERPDLGTLHVVHRLDRLTSGLLILARSSAAAANISEQIRDKEVKKFYVARVCGCLPSVEDADSLLSKIPYAKVMKSSITNKSSDKDDGSVSVQDSFILSCPLKCVDPRNSIHACAADGKPSSTEFQVIETNGKSSIVRCRPITGRTHQIRLHLQLLGCPIENDPNYNRNTRDYSSGVSSSLSAVNGVTAGAVDNVCSHDLENFDSTCKSAISQVADQSPSIEKGSASASSSASDAGSRKVISSLVEEPEGGIQETDEELENLKSICTFCRGGATEAFTLTQLKHHGIWLHAYHYEGEGWKYSVPLPTWSKLG